MTTGHAPAETRHETPLRRILREEGRKQVWLADRVGVSEAMMSMIVGGYHCADATQAAIAEALGRDISELFPTPTTGAAA